MTDKEYKQKRNKLWYEYTAMLRRNCSARYVFDQIFDCAYALGKQEKDAEDTVIQGWVGRDQDGYISLFKEKPTRDTCDKDDIPYGFWDDNTDSHMELPITSFPGLTWDDDPIEVELVIKRKKK